MAATAVGLFGNIVEGFLGEHTRRPYRELQIAPDGQVTLIANRGRNIPGVSPSVNARREAELTAYIRTGATPSADTLSRLQEAQWNQVVAAFQAFLPPVPIEPGDGHVPFEPAPQADRLFGTEHVTPIGAEDYFVPSFVRRHHSSIPGGEAGMRQMPAAVLVGIGATRRAPGGRKMGGQRRSRFGRVPHSRGGLAASTSLRRVQSHRGIGIKRRTKKRKGAHLVKGSRAAKLHMARLRRMRKR